MRNDTKSVADACSQFPPHPFLPIPFSHFDQDLSHALPSSSESQPRRSQFDVSLCLHLRRRHQFPPPVKPQLRRSQLHPPIHLPLSSVLPLGSPYPPHCSHPSYHFHPCATSLIKGNRPPATSPKSMPPAHVAVRSGAWARVMWLH